MRNLLPLLLAVMMLSTTGLAIACPGEKDCNGKSCGTKKSKKSKHQKKEEATQTKDNNATTETTEPKKEESK